MSERILIADDNRNVLNALSLFLPAEFNHVKTLQQPGRLMTELALMDYDVVLLDMNFTAGQQTGNEGIFWLREIKLKFPYGRKYGVLSSPYLFHFLEYLCFILLWSWAVVS